LRLVFLKWRWSNRHSERANKKAGAGAGPPANILADRQVFLLQLLMMLQPNLSAETIFAAMIID
jgi:hypothetical protein